MFKYNDNNRQKKGVVTLYFMVENPPIFEVLLT